MPILLALLISLAAAVIPTLVYALAFYWVDRYEREPIWLVIVAFLWGAIPAIVVSLIGELAIGTPFVAASDSVAGPLVGSAVVAPVVEELAKGVALWAIYRFYRQEFDGVLDGLIYGALIGFGFAMTENFLYFIGAFSQGGLITLSLVIYLRSIVFGLNHAFYTALFGLGLGLARQAPSRGKARLWAGLGLAAAMLTHALHNFGSSITSVNGLGFLLSLGLAALGVGLIGLAILLAWQQERRWIQEELADETGILLSREEYQALTRGWRRSPLLSQRRNPEHAKRLGLLVELAFRKHRLRRLGPERERSIEKQVQELRERIEREVEQAGGGRDAG